MSDDLEAIARRAARRALTGPGLDAPGVRVEVSPAPAARATPRRAERTLLDANALGGIPDGGALAVPHQAVVTPLARDEAQRRGIRLKSGEAPSTGSLRVAVGCDHGGFALKGDVMTSLRELGARPVDFGTRDTGAVDYPDFARAVAEAVATGQCDLGVVIDGAGIGSAIAANKVPGARAATCTDERMARNAREHNHANVLSIGSGWLSAAAAHGILQAFLTTPVGPERHARRVAKIDAIERRYSRSPLPGTQR